MGNYKVMIAKLGFDKCQKSMGFRVVKLEELIEVVNELSGQLQTLIEIEFEKVKHFMFKQVIVGFEK